MYKTHTLGNGIRIVCESIGYVHSVSVGVFIGNGSRHEPRSLSGISHFIEHMLFKGTQSRSALDIAEEIDLLGGSMNAYTTKEYTCFYAKMLEEHLETAVDVLSDMLTHPKLDKTDIELEKNVVYEEISMYEDSPEDLVHEVVMEAAWGAESGLGAPTLGTKQTLENIDAKTIRDYMDKMYVPKNCVISIAGNFDDGIIQMFEKYFGSWGESGCPTIKYDEKYKNGIIIRKKDIEQVHFCLGFPAFESENPKNYPLLAFNNAFGATMSSTLFQKVREQKGLVYSIFSYIASYVDTGMFVISASMKPENLDKVIDIVIRETNSAKNTVFDDRYMYKAKQQLKGNYILGLENVSSRMQSIGRSMLLFNKVRTPEQIIGRIDNINAEGTHEYVSQILDFNKMAACVMGNINENSTPFEKYQ